jgi:Family of unknown function (DUF6174)
VNLLYSRGMKSIIALCVMVVLVGSLSSCGLFDAFRCVSGYSRPDFGALRTQVAQQKQIWASKNLKTYAYTMQYDGEVAINFPLRITVLNGNVTSVIAILRPGQPKNGWVEPTDKSGYSMEQQFVNLETSLNSSEKEICAVFSASYDLVFAYPKGYGGGSAEINLADGIGGLSIFDFTITP